MLGLSREEIAWLVEFGEAEAYSDWFAAAPAGHDMRVARIGSAVALCMPDTPWMLFNRVIGLGVGEPATEAMVQACCDFYQGAGDIAFGFQLSQQAQPAELSEWLAARGFQRRSNWAKMIRPAEEMDHPTDLRIEQIDGSYAEAWAELVVTVFGSPDSHRAWMAAAVSRPDWRFYLAFDGDRPAAAGALFVRGGIGWLGAGSTLPEYRRRGAQSAIMARRIRDAARLGCRWVITETGEDTPVQPNPSYRNMLRSGFELAYLRPNYMKPAEAGAS